MRSPDIGESWGRPLLNGINQKHDRLAQRIGDAFILATIDVPIRSCQQYVSLHSSSSGYNQ